jgi:hypothetical protein
MVFVPATSPPHVPNPPPPLAAAPAPPFGTVVAYYLSPDHPEGKGERRLPAFVLGPGVEEGSRRLLVVGLTESFVAHASFPYDPRHPKPPFGSYEVLHNEDVADASALVGDGKRAAYAPRPVVGMTALYPHVDPSRPVDAAYTAAFDKPFGARAEGPRGSTSAPYGVDTADAEVERALDVAKPAPGISQDVLTDLLSALGVEATEERLTIVTLWMMQAGPLPPVLRPATDSPDAALAILLRALSVPVTPLRLDEARHAFRYLFSPERPRLPPQPHELWSILAARRAYEQVRGQSKLATGCFVVPWEAHTVLQLPLRLLAQAVREKSDLAPLSARLFEDYGVTAAQVMIFTRAVAAIHPDDQTMVEAMSREANWVG